MGRKSKIDQMPKEIRELIAGLFDAGKTIEQVKMKLWELVETGKLDEEQLPGKSAIGEHKKKLAVYTEKIRRSREVADVLVKRFGDAPESKIARLNIEMMHSIMLDLFMAAQDADPADGDVSITVDPMAVMLLSKSLDHLGRAAKSDADVVEKAREAAKKQAVAAVKKVGSKEGLTDDTIARIERELKLL